MEISLRIRQIRNALKLSQAKFGESIGVSRDVINNLELGRVEPKEYIRKLICSAYNVNDQWLENGQGEMFVPLSEDEEFDRLCVEIQMSDDKFIKNIMKRYWSLDETGKETIRQLLSDLSPK